MERKQLVCKMESGQVLVLGQVPSLYYLLFVLFGVINIVQLQKSGLAFTGMAEGTCDTKVTIIWTILSGTWWMELRRARSCIQ